MVAVMLLLEYMPDIPDPEVALHIRDIQMGFDVTSAESGPPVSRTVVNLFCFR